MDERQLAVVAHLPPVRSADLGTTERALAGFAALGQPTRLQVFRLLMKHVPEGLQAKAIADAVKLPHNTLSSHLSILARAGLIHGERRGRLIIYRADVQGLRALVEFLVHDCCSGHPEICSLLAGKA